MVFPLPFGRKNFMKETGAGLNSAWDSMFQNSFHLKQVRPAPTDIVYRHLVERLFQRWTAMTKGDWILKLDMYNEATWTRYGYYFLDRGVDLAFIEISRTVIRKARTGMMEEKVYRTAHPVLGDFRALPFRAECFALTMSFGSIEHVPEWTACLEEQRKVTKIGGIVLVGVPNLLNLWMRYWSCQLLDMIGVLKKFTSYELHFTPNGIRSAVRTLGLSDIEVTGYHLFPKQLRWLDLWVQQFSDRSVCKAKDLLLRPILELFETLEEKDTKLNLLGEMVMVKATNR